MSAPTQATVSLVIPLLNEAAGFSILRERLANLVAELPAEYEAEIVLIDDGSSDGTWEQICEFAGADARVKGISLSRNFGHQNALFCGYEAATGDAIVSMDGDLQDPPELILEMLAAWREGAAIVHAVRESRADETWFKIATAHAFYRFIRFVGEVHAPLDCGDFRLMSRKALDALLRMREKHKYLRGMVGWLGFESRIIHYQRPGRAAGETKFSLMKMLRFGIDGVLSFSKFPLRLAFWMSAVATLPFLIYLLYALIKSFAGGEGLVPGWTSLLLCIVVFGSLNLFALGILGEYVGRVFDTVKNRPDYLIANRTADKPTDDGHGR